MKNPLKSIAIISASILGFSLFGLTPTTFADDVCNSSAPEKVKDAAGCNGNSDDLPNVIVGILNGIIAALGLLAVIFVVIGGINYMTSSGDPAKVKKAKDTILYALIGMVVCVLAFAMVNFVIKNIIG